MENTLIVRAKERGDDVARANIMSTSGEPLHWSKGFSCAGMRFPVGGRGVEVTIVEGKPYPEDGEVNRDGALRILISDRLEVNDCPLVRELLAEALKEHKRKDDRYPADGTQKPFICATITDENFMPLDDLSVLPGHGKEWADDYAAMRKPALVEAMRNNGFDADAVKRISAKGKDAMIAALRGD